MKRCPECRRDYHDDTLSFCLADGTELVYGLVDDGPATALLQDTASPSEVATRAQVHTTDQTAVLPSLFYYLEDRTALVPSHGSKKTSTRERRLDKDRAVSAV